MPTFADLPDGFGTIATGLLLGFAFCEGLLVALGEAFGVATGFVVAFALGREVATVFPSFTVTLIFCPGFRLLIPNFAVEPEVEGLMSNFFDALGDGAGEGFKVGVAEGFGDSFGDAFGVGFGVAFRDGVGVTFGDGVGVAEGEGVGVGVTEGEGVGVTEGDGLGDGNGVTIVGAGALGAEGGEGTRKLTWAGITAADTCDGVDMPIEFTALTVNVYELPFVNPLTRIGELTPVTVSPVSTTVTMYRITSSPFPVAPLKVMIAAIFAGAAVMVVGGFGNPAGRAVAGADAAPVPTLFIAETVNV